MEIPKTEQIPLFNNGHWDFHRQMGDLKYVGFIYVIRDDYNFYLGKKHYKAGNWKNYSSSSNLLKEIFEEVGKESFKFYCIAEYETVGQLSYAETWSLCFLETPTRKTCLNRLIPKVSWKVPMRIPKSHKERLLSVVSSFL